MRKRSLSLIEVMISLLLVSLLLSTLFFWYRSLSSQKEKCDALKWPLMEERYAHQRLQKIFSTVQTPFFKTEPDKSLVFVFDRGPFSDPQLSGKVLARLYHDPHRHCLCLGVWPLPKNQEIFRTPTQTFVVLEGIEDYHFKFYHPPDPFRKPVSPEEVGKTKPKEGWQEQWSGSYTALPALVELWVKREPYEGLEQEGFSYFFDFPVPIVYPKERL